MKRKNPPYVQEFTDRDGTTPRFYLRKPGVKRVPLPGLPHSPTFMAAYEAALGQTSVPEIGASQTKPGTVNAAIVSYYKASADFKNMAASTQKNRRAILERFRSEHGHRNIATLDERALKAILAKRRPLAAINLLKTLRSLLRYAIDAEMRKDDPTVNIKLKAPKSDGHHSWTEGEILAFERRHPIGTKARLALNLLLYTGQRRGDVVQMARQYVSNNILSLTQEKTGNHVAIPVADLIWQSLNALPTGIDDNVDVLQTGTVQIERLVHQLTFLVTEQGKPFTSAGFGNWFRDRCDEAGLPQCSAHGLRKAAATRMAENGATTHELMSWFGWDSVSEAERYTKKADRARMNLGSAHKLISRTDIVKPETQFDKTTSKSLKS